MASLLSRSFSQFRFLLVAGLVFAILSTPFLGKALGTKSADLSITEIQDTVQGMSNEVHIQSKFSYRYLEALVSTPTKETLLFNLVSDAAGESILVLDPQHLESSGDYSVKVRDLESGSSSETKSFRVLPSATGGSSNYDVNFLTSSQSANVGEEVRVQVQLLDETGQAVAGHSLRMEAADSATYVQNDSFATDSRGWMDFYVTREEEGISSLEVFDSKSTQRLGSPLKLAFFGDSGVQLASSGNLAGFKITGLEGPVVMGRDTSFTVSAVDSEGFTVTDYTGSIHFSSSDAQAALPNDYQFLPADLGEHRFSLGVRFASPGTHTLKVTDLDNFTFEGETDVEVIRDQATTDIGNNFVTEDFQREGDFTLISPASGIYSVNEIEIQGAGDYGHDAIIYLDNKEVGRVEIAFDNSFTFTLKDLPDGTYSVRADIAELGPGKMETADVLNVLESSDTESITIDTEAPELIKVESNQTEDIAPGEVITLTILTDSEVTEGAVVFEGEIIKMKPTSTPKKYTAELLAPKSGGDYTVDIILEDELGNQTQYKDQLALKVAGDRTEEPSAPSEGKTVLGPVTYAIATAGEAKVMLSWETPVGNDTIAYYQISYGPSATALLAHTNTQSSATTWTVPGLTPGQIHYFMVQAVSAEGVKGPVGATVSATPLGSSTSSSTADTVIPTGQSSTIISTHPPKENPDTGAPALLMLGVSGGLVFLDRLRRLC